MGAYNLQGVYMYPLIFAQLHTLHVHMYVSGPGCYKHGHIYPVDKQNYHLYANSYNYSYRVAILGIKPTFNGLLTNTSLIPIALTKVKI
jgi:hypothetical protein